MKNLIYIELYKLFGSLRTYVVLGLSVVLMLIIHLGFYQEGERIFDFLLDSISAYFILDGRILNGYLVTYLAMNTLWVHLPILIIIVSAYIFAGDFELGTIRLLLTQPVSRGSVFLAKLVSMVVFNLVFMAITLGAALLPAYVLFGTGDLVVFIDGIQFLQEESIPVRILDAFAYSVLSMVAFSCLGMVFGIFFRNTLTAILLSMGILILSTLLQKFVFGIFSAWQPFLISYHFSKWQFFFVDEIPKESIRSSVMIQFLFCLLVTTVTYVKFKRMNISE